MTSTVDPSLPRRTTLCASLRRRGQHLLNQQCWAWGRDVGHPAGNLLLEHGFERLRCPDGVQTSTQYSLALPSAPPTPAGPGPSSRSVRLWGFGFFYGEAQTSASHSGSKPYRRGIFLNRFEFLPRLANDLPEFCHARHMAALRRSAHLDLVPDALRWIGAYEEWVLQHVGLPYRRSVVASWSVAPRRPILPQLVPDAWSHLAEDIEAWHRRLDRSSRQN